MSLDSKVVKLIDYYNLNDIISLQVSKHCKMGKIKCVLLTEKAKRIWQHVNIKPFFTDKCYDKNYKSWTCNELCSALTYLIYNDFRGV